MRRSLKVAIHFKHSVPDIYIRPLLETLYDVRFVSSDPDLAIGDEGVQYIATPCPNICFFSENYVLGHWNFHSLTHFFVPRQTDADCQTYSFLPFMEKTFLQLLSGKLADNFVQLRAVPKTRFCNFLYYHVHKTFPDTIVRRDFAVHLMKYKKVDCPSEVLNNTAFAVAVGPDNKREFLSHYKFTIAMENSCSAGYITEKIMDPFLVGSIPIYHGSPDIADYFNPKAFVNCHDYANFNAVIERVKEIDNNPELYESYRQAPPILPDSKLHDFSPERMKETLHAVIERLVSNEGWRRVLLIYLQNILVVWRRIYKKTIARHPKRICYHLRLHKPVYQTIPAHTKTKLCRLCGAAIRIKNASYPARRTPANPQSD